MMDLGDVIDQESVAIQIVRKSGGSYVHGKWVGEVSTPEAATGAIQSVSGSTLRDLSEGERADATYLLWTRSSLALDDVVIYEGGRHRIIKVWPRPEGSFYRAVLGRLP